MKKSIIIGLSVLVVLALAVGAVLYFKPFEQKVEEPEIGEQVVILLGEESEGTTGEIEELSGNTEELGIALPTNTTIQYCIDSSCGYYKEQRFGTGTPGFPPATSSGFIVSEQSISQQPFLRPVSNNGSTIYFDNTYNNSFDDTFNGSYTLNGQIMKNVESIEIIWDGDNKSFFLKKFIPKSGKFTYNISLSLGNIKPGKNIYLIRGYQSPNQVFERTFELYFVTGGNDIILKQVYEDLPEDQRDGGDCEIGFGNFRNGKEYRKGDGDRIIEENPNKHLLGISNKTLAKQIFNIPNTNITLIYQNSINKNKKIQGYIMMLNGDSGQSSNTVEYRLRCDYMGGASVALHSGGYITIYLSYFESSNDALLYNPTTNKILSINEDLLKPALQDNFYHIYSYEIQGDSIVITEQPYCCDDVPNPGGYEKFTFDLMTQKLLSKQAISTPIK